MNAPRQRSQSGRCADFAVEDVTVTYRNGQTALRDASFAIPRGTITALVGVNGSRQVDAVQGDHGLRAAGRAARSRILGMPVERGAASSNLVAYVPQAEEVDWNFPVLVEDVVMMGRYGHMDFLRMARKPPTAQRSTRRWRASA